MARKRISEQVAFGLAVRDFRHEREISQEELADRCGLHRTYVGSVERGERNVSLQNIHLLAAALGITASQLVRSAEEVRNRPGAEKRQGNAG